jgi:hypothetical protein
MHRRVVAAWHGAHLISSFSRSVAEGPFFGLTLGSATTVFFHLARRFLTTACARCARATKMAAAARVFFVVVGDA